MVEIDVNELDRLYEQFKKNGGYIFISALKDDRKSMDQKDYGSVLDPHQVVGVLHCKTQEWVNVILKGTTRKKDGKHNG